MIASRRAWRTSLAVATMLAMQAQAATASTVDIRDCPLETTTFVDWLGETSFSAKRVGTAYSYMCEDSVEPPDASCAGPYGELVVQGELQAGSAADPETVHAIWSVYKAVPCCGWSLARDAAFDPANLEGFAWLEPGTGPKLRDEAFYTIGSDDEPVFERPMFAVACTMP